MMKYKGKEVKESQYNPRIETQNKGMKQLEKSIKLTGGVLQRIVLRDKETYWETVLGHRRIKALVLEGRTELKDGEVDVKNISDKEACEMVTSEGLAHEDLSYVEKGKTCKDLLATFPERYTSQRELARNLGFDEKIIRDWLSSYDSWCDASVAVPSLLEQVEIISKPKKNKKGILSSETFKEIATAFKEEPKKVAEVAIEAANRGITRSQIRKVKKILKEVPETKITEAMDIAQNKVTVERNVNVVRGKVLLDSIKKLVIDFIPLNINAFNELDIRQRDEAVKLLTRIHDKVEQCINKLNQTKIIDAEVTVIDG